MKISKGFSKFSIVLLSLMLMFSLVPSVGFAAEADYPAPTITAPGLAFKADPNLTYLTREQLMSGVVATDYEGNDLSAAVEIIDKATGQFPEISYTKLWSYQVIYRVTDSHGKTAEAMATIYMFGDTMIRDKITANDFEVTIAEVQAAIAAGTLDDLIIEHSDAQALRSYQANIDYIDVGAVVADAGGLQAVADTYTVVLASAENPITTKTITVTVVEPSESEIAIVFAANPLIISWTGKSHVLSQDELKAEMSVTGSNGEDLLSGAVATPENGVGIDTRNVGIYTVSYSVEDSTGQTASKSRLIIVNQGVWTIEWQLLVSHDFVVLSTDIQNADETSTLDNLITALSSTKAYDHATYPGKAVEIPVNLDDLGGMSSTEAKDYSVTFSAAPNIFGTPQVLKTVIARVVDADHLGSGLDETDDIYSAMSFIYGNDILVSPAEMTELLAGGSNAILQALDVKAYNAPSATDQIIGNQEVDDGGLNPIDAVIVSTDKPLAAEPGTYQVTVADTAGIASVTCTIIVNDLGKPDQAPLTINNPGPKTYGDTSFKLASSGGSGIGSVTYSTVSSNVLTVTSDGMVTIQGAGTAEVIATKAGDKDYNPTSATLTITVSPRDIVQTVLLISGDATYTGKQLKPSFSINDGIHTITAKDYNVSYGQNITVAKGGSVTLTGRGNYTGTVTARFEIAKAIPQAPVFPTAGATTYSPTQTLADIALKGGSKDGSFAWADSSIVPTPENDGYSVIFTPKDVLNYDYSAIELSQVVTLIVKPALSTQTNKFTDVKDSDWFNSYVYYVATAGIMTGYDSTHFGPNDNITRGQVITVLYRLDNPNAKGTEKNTSGMTDVKDNQYYTAAVNWGVNAKVISGYTAKDGMKTFKPNNAISRQELATILYNYAKYKGKVTGTPDMKAFNSLKDHDTVAPYAKSAFAWCVDKNIISGVNKTDGRYADPKGNATRGMMAKMMTDMMKGVLK